MKVLKLLLISVLIVWSYQTLSYANPEEITFKSPLIWRADGKGDYLIPETYELPTAITTKGTIDTITASWEFTGEVTMELSADNGAHYTPVTNGVPLDSLLYTGNRLKWRASIGENSELTKVKLTYTAKAVIASFGEPKLTGFKYRRALLINQQTTGQTLFNYQMKFQVDESLTKANFKDIRFTSADGETILPHYLERIAGSSPNRIGIFWVKIPQIPEKGTTIYLYYENPFAEDLSDPERVFDFYDDFDGSQIDTEKWDVSPGLGGSYELSDSKLKLDSTRIVSKEFEIRDGIIEVQAYSDSDTWFVIRSQGQEETDQVAYGSMYPGAEHCIAVGNIVKENAPKPISIDALYNYRITTEGRKLTFERYGTEDSLEASVTYKDKDGLKQGAVGLEVSQDNVSYYEWLRVRRYAEVEPIISSEGKEEVTNLAQFSGTTVAGTGDVIPAKASGLAARQAGIQGEYVSQVIPTGFETRIIVPKWTHDAQRTTQDAIHVDVSADKGIHYKKDCENGVYYYASRGDFTPGSNLQYRLKLAKISDSKLAKISEISLDYAPGKITLISPNGGETLTVGTQKEISWTASEYESSYLMKLEYSLDKGKTYKLITKETSNDGSYLWTVPDEVSKKAMIKISDALDEEVYDTSDGVFVIQEREARDEGRETRDEGRTTQDALRKTQESEEVDLNKLIETGKRPGAQLYDLLIKLGDNHHIDPEEDARACYKEGDIVVVRPHGHEWSETEKNSFLIIQMYLTEEEAQDLTKPKEELTGEVDKDGRLIMKTVRRRANRIDLQTKLGLPDKAKSNRYEKLGNIRNTLKDKPLNLDVIEEKQ